MSAALDLPIFQFHRSSATENGDRDTEFAALGIDFFDDSGLVLEWAIGDFHRFANFKADFRFHLFFALFHLSEHAVDFGLSHRARFVLRSGKTDHTRRLSNEIPGPANELIVLVEYMHVHDQV